MNNSKKIIPIKTVVAEPINNVSTFANNVGRTAIFQLKTGKEFIGKILDYNDTWIDTDQGAVRVDNIVFARWIDEKQAAIRRRAFHRYHSNTKYLK